MTSRQQPRAAAGVTTGGRWTATGRREPPLDPTLGDCSNDAALRILLASRDGTGQLIGAHTANLLAARGFDADSYRKAQQAGISVEDLRGEPRLTPARIDALADDPLLVSWYRAHTWARDGLLDADSDTLCHVTTHLPAFEKYATLAAAGDPGRAARIQQARNIGCTTVDLIEHEAAETLSSALRLVLA